MDFNYATQSALNQGEKVSYLNKTCPIHRQNSPEDEDVFQNRKTNPCRKEWSKKVVPPYIPSKIHADHSVFKVECSRWAGQMAMCNKKRRRVFLFPPGEEIPSPVTLGSYSSSFFPRKRVSSPSRWSFLCQNDEWTSEDRYNVELGGGEGRGGEGRKISRRVHEPDQRRWNMSTNCHEELYCVYNVQKKTPEHRDTTNLYLL